jgi:hypothetical protein
MKYFYLLGYQDSRCAPLLLFPPIFFRHIGKSARYVYLWLKDYEKKEGGDFPRSKAGMKYQETLYMSGFACIINKLCPKESPVILDAWERMKIRSIKLTYPS